MMAPSMVARSAERVALPLPEGSAVKSLVSPFQIPSLDGLRAVSFMLVFLAHAGFDRVVPGGFGVTVFFFLSGYLITTLMRKEAERIGHVSLKAFYLRRALRILPPFYLVLFAATALVWTGALREHLRFWPVAAQALHFSNYWLAYRGWDGIVMGTGVYWSLAVEEHFYLLFPALYIGTRAMKMTGRQQAYVFWFLCAAVFAWRCLLIFGLHSNFDRTYLCSDTRIDSMLFGCALAVYGNPMIDAPARPPSFRLWMGAALPIAIITLLVTFVVRGETLRQTARYTLQGLALVPVFVCAVRWPESILFRWLNARPVRFLGTLSYSLYLVHHVVLSVLESNTRLPRLPRAAVGLALAVAVSWAIYTFVEKPCARIRRRLSAVE
jgi:peptidoglycan/LPS O-acetylase OafA/YrhL